MKKICIFILAHVLLGLVGIFLMKLSWIFPVSIAIHLASFFTFRLNKWSVHIWSLVNFGLVLNMYMNFGLSWWISSVPVLLSFVVFLSVFLIETFHVQKINNKNEETLK